MSTSTALLRMYEPGELISETDSSKSEILINGQKVKHGSVWAYHDPILKIGCDGVLRIRVDITLSADEYLRLFDARQQADNIQLGIRRGDDLFEITLQPSSVPVVEAEEFEIVSSTWYCFPTNMRIFWNSNHQFSVLE